MPKAMVAASNAPSSVGRSSASPTVYERPSRAAYRCCATAVIPGDRSTPSTRPPGWTRVCRSAATLPVPDATSSAAPPGRSPARDTRRFRQRGSWNAEINRFMTSYRAAIRSNITWTSGEAAALPSPVEAPDGVWSGGRGVVMR